MDIRPYEYLFAIAEEGSLSCAAKKLHITQSTLSHFLNHWEQQIGQPLFNRTTRRLTPTSIGTIYIHAARQIMEIKKQTYQAIDMLNSHYRQTIMLGITPHSGAEIYTYVFKEFSSCYPDILLNTKEGYMSDLKDLLRKKELDFVIGTASDFSKTDLEFMRFGRHEILLSCSEFHPLAARVSAPDSVTGISLKEVKDIPFIRSAPGTTLCEITDSLFSYAGISPTIVFESENTSLNCELIRSNQGIGLLPYSYIHKNPGLRCFSLQPQAWMNVGIFYPTGHSLTDYEKHFIYICYSQSILRRKHPHFIIDPSPAVQALISQFENIPASSFTNT